MFKILIRNRDINDTSKLDKFSFYQEGGKDYETDNKDAVSQKINDLLDIYLRKDIQLAQMFEIVTNVTSNAPEVGPDVDSNIIPENIKKGITILGVTGIYEGETIEDGEIIDY